MTNLLWLGLNLIGYIVALSLLALAVVAIRNALTRTPAPPEHGHDCPVCNPHLDMRDPG